MVRLLCPVHAYVCSIRQMLHTTAQLMHCFRLRAALNCGALQGDKRKLPTSSQQKAGSGCLDPGQAEQGAHSRHDSSLPIHRFVRCHWLELGC